MAHRNRRRQVAPPVAPLADEGAALRALLRPYAGRALPDDEEILLARARSALRQAGLAGTARAARALVEAARASREGASPEESRT